MTREMLYADEVYKKITKLNSSPFLISYLGLNRNVIDTR